MESGKKLTNLDELITTEELAKHLNVCKSSIWNWRRLDNFPKPYHLGKRLLRWNQSEVDDWVLKRKI